MIEKDLESRIIAAINALGVNGLAVVGAWDVSDEIADTAAIAGVTVSPRSYSRYTVCEASFPVSIDLAASIAMDKDGAVFVVASTAISDMLHAWNMNRANEAKTALAVPSVLSIGGIRVSGGNPPYLDRMTGRRTVSFSFEVTGFIDHNYNKTTQGE